MHKTKVNRPKFQYDKIFMDSEGRTVHYFPKWKRIVRQLLQVPFFAIAAAALGAIICAIFAFEVLISEAYEGPYQYYLVSEGIDASSSTC